jgi:hypothetical protein
MTGKASLFLKRFEKQGIDPQLLVNFFANIGLPIPQKGQYFVTSDGGALVCVNDAGVLLRFSCKESERPCHNIRHKDVIQPIEHLTHGNLVIELLPGLKLGFNHDDTHKLIANLKADRLHYDDSPTKVENMGYLPDGRAVILDRNAVVPMEGYVDNGDPSDLPLAHVRQVLHKQFTAEIPDPFHDTPQGNAMKFWELCKKIKQSGQLVCGWLDKQFEDVVYYHNHGQTSEVQKRSIAYQQDILKHWHDAAPITTLHVRTSHTTKDR